MEPSILFLIIILIMSVVIHEVAHGYSALWLGDQTAKLQGRLTLNPIKHLDWLGSVILPGLLILMSAGIILGWAKPVPYNPYNLKNRRWGELIVAIAGPLSNIAIALVFSIIIRLAPQFDLAMNSPFIMLSSFIVLINLGLACFNMIPIPPLDGSKVLFAFLPESAIGIRNMLERYGLVLFIVFLFLFSSILFPVVMFLFKIMTGINFM